MRRKPGAAGDPPCAGRVRLWKRQLVLFPDTFAQKAGVRQPGTGRESCERDGSLAPEAFEQTHAWARLGAPGGSCGQRAWVRVTSGDLPASSPLPRVGAASRCCRHVQGRPRTRGALLEGGPARASLCSSRRRCRPPRLPLWPPPPPSSPRIGRVGFPGPSGNHAHGARETGEASDPTPSHASPFPGRREALPAGDSASTWTLLGPARGSSWGGGGVPIARDCSGSDDGLRHAPAAGSALTVRDVSVRCDSISAVRFPVIIRPFPHSHLHQLLLDWPLRCALRSCPPAGRGSVVSSKVASLRRGGHRGPEDRDRVGFRCAHSESKTCF